MTVPTYELSPSVISKLFPYISGKHQPIDVAPGALMKALTAGFQKNIPMDLTEDLRAFSLGDHEPFYIIRGLETETDLPPTPAEGIYPEEGANFSINAIIGIMSLMDLFPHAYASENDGKLARAVVPASYAADTQGSHGSSQTLGFHSDGAFLRFEGEERAGFAPAPDFLFMFCNRGDASAKTTYISCDTLIEALPDWAVHVLLRPEFTVLPAQSFVNKIEDPSPVPILFDHEVYGPQIRYYQNRTTAHTAEAKKAVRLLERVFEFEDLFDEICLMPGDMMVINNHKALHGRTAFEAVQDGKDRWLTRIYGSRAKTIFDAREHFEDGSEHIWTDYIPELATKKPSIHNA